MLSVVPDSGLAPPCAGARPGNNSEPAAAAPARNNCRRRSRRSKIIIFLASPVFPSILAEREILDKAPAQPESLPKSKSAFTTDYLFPAKAGVQGQPLRPCGPGFPLSRERRVPA